MIKHILSKYSEKDESIRRKVDKGALVKAIYETSTIKKDDSNEFLNMGNTLETRTKEDSDPDEFVLGPTLLTENVEVSDPDEFVVAGPTKSTFTKEDSDPDEFLVDDIEICSDGDFDEILLI
ncbi:hypothetical protein [Tissierella praeacuta]|uniref:hypothetical protein n=1 Tax=Tissierella praeacuta TaxID=43131 RepID=UPI0028AF8F6B|nr:hypothetical protein [Tissierella praeacuta]